MNIPADEFQIASTGHYLNTAAIGPWPARTVKAVQDAAARAQFLEPDRARGEPSIFDETRTRLARLLHVDGQDLVFGPNTSFGLNICTHGIDWRAGDNLVVPATEFPSVQYSLIGLPALGVEVRKAAWQGSGPGVDDIMARVDARTRAVICSAISWDLGYRIDLAELGARCARAGVLLLVDGIHAAGAEPLDLKALRVSAFSFHGYKWLMAGFGTGVLYVAPDAVNQIAPTYAGPQGVEGNMMIVQDPITWKAGAQRYSMGTGNAVGANALNASLTLIESLGVEAIAAHNHGLADALHAGLRRALAGRAGARIWRSDAPEHQSAIVVFTLGDQAADGALVDALAQKRVTVALRPQGIRISPHCFNTPADVEALLRCLSN